MLSMPMPALSGEPLQTVQWQDLVIGGGWCWQWHAGLRGQYDFNRCADQRLHGPQHCSFSLCHSSSGRIAAMLVS